ncbi:unnamed protein product [Prunus armeniaca]
MRKLKYGKSWAPRLGVELFVSHHIYQMMGGWGSSMSSAHDDPFILLLGGRHGQSSLLRTAAVPSGEVVIRVVHTWLLKGHGHSL